MFKTYTCMYLCGIQCWVIGCSHFCCRINLLFQVHLLFYSDNANFNQSGCIYLNALFILRWYMSYCDRFESFFSFLTSLLTSLIGQLANKEVLLQSLSISWFNSSCLFKMFSEIICIFANNQQECWWQSFWNIKIKSRPKSKHNHAAHRS